MNMTFCVTLADAWPEEARPIPTDIVTGSSTADRANRFTSIGIVADHSWQQSESQHISMCGCVSAQQHSHHTPLCVCSKHLTYQCLSAEWIGSSTHLHTNTHKRQCHQCNDKETHMLSHAWVCVYISQLLLHAAMQHSIHLVQYQILQPTDTRNKERHQVE